MTLAIYIHWPYCISKCPYCDFNSHVGDTTDQEKWRRAYRRELEHYAPQFPARRVTSIFFGGGTPSLMEPRTVASVLNDIARLWPLDPAIEITLEANPSSAEAAAFADFRAAGVNRLSLGIQSLHDDALRFLGRAHDAAQAHNAIALASRIFPRFSFDLIYARQNQTPEQWRQELTAALALAGDHLSLYQLTIEPNTQFHTRSRRGESLTAIDDHAATMYELTQEIMASHNLPAYEISNHARAGQASRHNLTYWRYEDYLGIGPGAHGRLGIQNANRPDKTIFCQATENIRAPDLWLQQTDQKGHGRKTQDPISPTTAMREALLMGLRLTEGIDRDIWQTKFETPLSTLIDPSRLNRLIAENYLAPDPKTLRATRAGLQRLNAVLDYLLNAQES